MKKGPTGASLTTTLTSGTASTAIEAKAICLIIRECRRSGVSAIEFKDIKIQFSNSSKLEELPKKSEPQIETVAIATVENTEPQQPFLSQLDEQMLKEFDELQLAIDDPLAYENAQIREDLEDERVRGFEREEIRHRGIE